MLKWAVLLVLVGVTSGDIQRIENVTDSCGNGDLKMCGKDINFSFFCSFVASHCLHCWQDFVIATGSMREGKVRRNSLIWSTSMAVNRQRITFNWRCIYKVLAILTSCCLRMVSWIAKKGLFMISVGHAKAVRLTANHVYIWLMAFCFLFSLHHEQQIIDDERHRRRRNSDWWMEQQ